MSQTTSKIHLVICDTNVVMMMVLFKPSIMFSNIYSFGHVEIHQSVIDEMQTWIDRNNRKAQKFTKPIIEQAIKLSQQHTGKLKQLTHEEMNRSHRTISSKEAKLEPHQKGFATSKTDKDLLAFAWKNQASLATQERTMRSIGELTLGKDRVISFEELVVDLIKNKKITKTEVTDGISAIENMNEYLHPERAKLIKTALE